MRYHLLLTALVGLPQICVGLLIADQQSICSAQGLVFSLSYCELQTSKLCAEQTFHLDTRANGLPIHGVQDMFFGDLFENHPSHRGTGMERIE